MFFSSESIPLLPVLFGWFSSLYQKIEPTTCHKRITSSSESTPMLFLTTIDKPRNFKVRICWDQNNHSKWSEITVFTHRKMRSLKYKTLCLCVYIFTIFATIICISHHCDSLLYTYSVRKAQWGFVVCNAGWCKLNCLGIIYLTTWNDFLHGYHYRSTKSFLPALLPY